MQETVQARIMTKKGSETYWNTRNPRLLNGEFAIVEMADRNRIKIGDGIHNYEDLAFFDESGGDFKGNATTSTLPDPASGTIWYFAGPGIYTNFLDADGDPIEVEGPLSILSRVSGIWSQLVIVSVTGYTETRYIIKQGGTPTVDCDDTTISGLYYFVATNSATNRYVFEVLPGVYEEDDGLGFNFTLKDYMDIVGYNDTSGDRPILKGPEAPTGPDEGDYNTLKANARCKVQNMDIIGFKNASCVYFNDATDHTSETIFEDCRFQHFGGATGSGYREVFAIMKYSQILRFKNCKTLSNLLGILVSNNTTLSDRDNSASFLFSMVGCRVHQLVITDYLQYSRDKIELIGNEINTIANSLQLSLYTANPGDGLVNRGFYPNPIKIYNYGNRIGRNIPSADYLTVNNGLYPAYMGHNVEMTNASGSTIAQGIAVIRVANSALPNAWSAGDTNIDVEQINAYSGGSYGKVEGFTQQSISAGANGMVRISQNSYGETLAAFDTVNGAVVYGDELELLNNGKIAKLSAGTLFGYARGANSGGFVQIKRA